MSDEPMSDEMRVMMLLRRQPTDVVRTVRDANTRELDFYGGDHLAPFLRDARIVLALANAELARRII